MAKVTVVVPVYNNAQYLHECLDSIVNQTLEDIEIICVNDGSTDDSLTIMKDYAARDGRISIIDKPNSGYGDSMNRAFDRASGEYVTTLESDDAFPLNACEIMYTFAKDNGDLDFLKADAEVFYGEGDERSFVYSAATEIKRCYEGVFAPAEKPGIYFGRSGQPGMYRVSFLRENGIRHNDSPGASFQDAGFWAQCMFCGRNVRYLDSVCYLIRRDNPRSSESDLTKVLTICTEYQFIRDRIGEIQGIDKQRCHEACSYFAYIAYKWNATRISMDREREFFARFSSDFNAYAEAGWIDWDLFDDKQAADLRKIMDDPTTYYYEELRIPWEVEQWVRDNQMLLDALDRAETELAELKDSKRYKLGSLIAMPIEMVRGDK